MLDSKPQAISREAQIQADRERIYVVIAYSEPPQHLHMKLAKSGKCWFKRATGVLGLKIVDHLRACGIKGVIKASERFLAGTPNYIKPERADSAKPPQKWAAKRRTLPKAHVMRLRATKTPIIPSSPKAGNVKAEPRASKPLKGNPAATRWLRSHAVPPWPDKGA